MVLRRSTLVHVFTALLTSSMSLAISGESEIKDIFGMRHPRSPLHHQEHGTKLKLSCHCMSAMGCPNGAQLCSNEDDYCMVAKVFGKVRAAGCTPQSRCRSPAITCCRTSMCNTIPGQEDTRTILTIMANATQPNEGTSGGGAITTSTALIATDSSAKQTEMTALTRFETTSSGLTRVKSSLVLLVSLIAVTLNI